MTTASQLKNQTKAELLVLAKELGVGSASSMRKDDLVSALAKASKKAIRKSSTARGASAKASPSSKNAKAKLTSPSKASSRSVSAKAGSKSSGSSSKSSPTRRAARPSSGKATSKSSSKTSPTSKATSKASSSAKSAPKGSAKQSSKTQPTAKSSARASSKKAEVASAKPKRAVSSKSKSSKSQPKTNPRVLKKIREVQLQKEANQDISFRPTLVRPPGAAEPIWEKEPQKDRVALFVRDAFWMHAAWDITRSAVERAKASLAEQWHVAKPVLRVLRLEESGETSASETVERDIEIHGGLRNWYIDWTGEAARFRVMVGYLTPSGKFHSIAVSNIVKTPQAGSSDAVDEHWADSSSDSERIFALSGGYDDRQVTGEMREMLEARVNHAMGAPPLAKLGAGAGAEAPYRKRGAFHFEMDIELVVYGSTMPDTYLTLSGEPVALRPDGTFVMRLPFPDKRQVLPAVALSRDGSQQRTIVVAVERNTKIMEPLESERDTGE